MEVQIFGGNFYSFSVAELNNIESEDEAFV